MSLAFQSIVAAVEPLLGVLCPDSYSLLPSVDPRTDSMATPSSTSTPRSFNPDPHEPCCGPLVALWSLALAHWPLSL